jgi:tetratricopeptide (TPR) repeat protein
MNYFDREVAEAVKNGQMVARLNSILGDISIEDVALTEQQKKDRAAKSPSLKWVKGTECHNNFPIQEAFEEKKLEAELLEQVMLLGVSLAKQGDYESACDVLENVLHNPLSSLITFHHLRFWLADCYQNLGEENKAIKLYELNRQNFCHECVGSNLSLHEIYIYRGEVRKAEEYLQNAYKEVLWRLNFLLSESGFAFRITETSYDKKNLQNKKKFCEKLHSITSLLEDEDLGVLEFHRNSPLKRLPLSAISFIKAYHSI